MNRIKSLKAKNLQQPIAQENASHEVRPGKRMTITLSEEAAELLEFLANSQCITQKDALGKAIATEAYFRREAMQGSTILVQKPNNQLREVVLR
ncbi:MAG TPA: hypothetical protein VK211_27435 [Kamptonema sp.]|nr:hypothetical protein [Kamptonema sp.]